MLAMEGEHQVVIERSKFIANAKCIYNISDAQLNLAIIKDKYKQATHYCSAYTYGLSKEKIENADDNGEPSGSAGKPILGVINSKYLNNVMIVVVRYYGGKKLGIRGLIDAYTLAATQLVEKLGTLEKAQFIAYNLHFNYQQSRQIYYLIEKHQIKIVSQEYSDIIKLRVYINDNNIEPALDELQPWLLGFEKSNEAKVLFEK
ncbi:MAG: YigZ family protein [Clostridia bacterium]